jgi:hypothetical protein
MIPKARAVDARVSKVIGVMTIGDLYITIRWAGENAFVTEMDESLQESFVCRG